MAAGQLEEMPVGRKDLMLGVRMRDVRIADRNGSRVRVDM